MPIEMTHSNLCDIAVKWLKKPNSKGGAGCHIAVSEMAGGWSGEIPDAIGFRAAGWDDGSTVVEVKVSRSDFLADRNKPHRNGERLGMGKWRFYLCPEGLISPEEVPEKWGLVYVTKRGGTKCIKGHAGITNMNLRKDAISADQFECDRDREMFLLVKLMSRVGDVEALHQKLRGMYRAHTEMQKQINEQQERLKNSIIISNRKNRRAVAKFADELERKEWEDAVNDNERLTQPG